MQRKRCCRTVPELGTIVPGPGKADTGKEDFRWRWTVLRAEPQPRPVAFGTGAGVEVRARPLV